jgi:hypothetical protein
VVEPSGGTSPQPPAGIDKSVLAIPEPKRHRNKEHLRFVARQPCLVCDRTLSDPHHLRLAQARALGRKVSDEFVVPLCRSHHRALHRVGNELGWWQTAGIDPLDVARKLWAQTQTRLSEQIEPTAAAPLTEPKEPAATRQTGSHLRSKISPQTAGPDRSPKAKQEQRHQPGSGVRPEGARIFEE